MWLACGRVKQDVERRIDMRRVPSVDLSLLALAAVLLCAGAVLLIVDVGHESIAIPLFVVGFALVLLAESVRGRQVPSSHRYRSFRTGTRHGAGR
jgi:hypothetical protein